jgi:hypothetical protein
MKKANKCQNIQRVKNCLVWGLAVFHWKKPELGQGKKPYRISNKCNNCVAKGRRGTFGRTV